MYDYFRAWKATFTRRWHHQFDLADTNDPNSGHQHRTALLLLLFWPDISRDALVAAVIHDQGEMAAGDLGRGAKRKYPELRAMLREIEDEEIQAQTFPKPGLDHEHHERIRFCDMLDAYLWAMKHKPHILRKSDWLAQREEMYNMARHLGVAPQYTVTMLAAENEMIPR